MKCGAKIFSIMKWLFINCTKQNMKIWTNYIHYMVSETFQNSMEFGKGDVNHNHTIVPMKIWVNEIATQQYYGVDVILHWWICDGVIVWWRWCDCAICSGVIGWWCDCVMTMVWFGVGMLAMVWLGDGVIVGRCDCAMSMLWLGNCVIGWWQWCNWAMEWWAMMWLGDRELLGSSIINIQLMCKVWDC